MKKPLDSNGFFYLRDFCDQIEHRTTLTALILAFFIFFAALGFAGFFRRQFHFCTEVLFLLFIFFFLAHKSGLLLQR